VIEITGPIPSTSFDVFANVIGELTLHPAVDCRRWWSRRAAPRAPILWWNHYWRRFRRRIPEIDERPRWPDWTSPGTSDLALAFLLPWKKKFKGPFETRHELTNAFWNAFHFFIRYGIVYFFSFIRLAYFIMWWRFRMSLVKHWSSHRAQIWSYINSSSSYFAVTFLTNQSSSLSSCQIALFSILVPPSLGITITWPNRPAIINGFNRSLTKQESKLFFRW